MASDTSAQTTLDNSGGSFAAQALFRHRDSNRVARMRAEYPDQLDYSGHAQISQQTKAGNNSIRPCTSFPHSSFPPQQPQMAPSGLEGETLWLLAIRSDQLSYESSWPLQLLGEGFMLPFLFAHLKTAHHSQSA